MNIPVFIASIITLLAFIAHSFFGVKESLSLSPEAVSNKQNTNDQDTHSTLKRHWLQSMCAFQMITIDLLMLTIVLFLISLTQIISFEKHLTLALSSLFFLWGVAWLIQLVVLTKEKRDFIYLSQWAFWLICSALLYVGAQSM